MADETVRDRIARTIFETAPYSWSWEELTSAGREEWLRQADALLAAFPEIGLFERLETWLRAPDSHHRGVSVVPVIDYTTGERYLLAEMTGTGAAVAEGGPTAADALSNALGQVETAEVDDTQNSQDCLPKDEFREWTDSVGVEIMLAVLPDVKGTEMTKRDNDADH